MKTLLLLSYNKKKKLKTKHWRWPHHNAYTMCHTHGVTNQYDSTSPKGPKQDIDMKTNEHLWASVPATDQKKYAHQWRLAGARMKIVWKIKAVKCLTSYTEGLDTTEQVTRRHHCRNKHEPPYERLTTLLGMSTRMHHMRGFHPPLHPFFLSFHFHDMLTRALYNKCRYRYRYLPVEKNPHLFFYITAALGLPFHNL